MTPSSFSSTSPASTSTSTLLSPKLEEEAEFGVHTHWETQGLL